MPETCRSCGAEVEFGVPLKRDGTLGKRMPLDLGLYDLGNLEVIGKHGFAPIVRQLSPGELEDARTEGRPLRRSHFASCPDADRWRRS